MSTARVDAEGGDVEVESAIRLDTGEQVELTDSEIETLGKHAASYDEDYDEREYEPYDYRY